MKKENEIKKKKKNETILQVELCKLFTSNFRQTLTKTSFLTSMHFCVANQNMVINYNCHNFKNIFFV